MILQMKKKKVLVKNMILKIYLLKVKGLLNRGKKMKKEVNHNQKKKVNHSRKKLFLKE